MMRNVAFLFLSAFTLLAQDPFGHKWERVDLRNEKNGTDFLALNGSIIVVGTGGQIWRSNDRETWSADNTDATQDLQHIAEGNNVFIAVGDHGTVLRERNPGVWRSESANTTADLKKGAFGNGIFVAVGSDGTILRSTTDAQWSLPESGVTSHLNDVIWDGSHFLIIGDVGVVLRSGDGIIWTPYIQTDIYFTPPDFNSIRFVNGEYFIDGRYRSSDGVDFDWFDSPVETGAFAVHALSKVSLYKDSTLWISDDDQDWELVTLPTAEEIVSIHWTGESFLAMTPSRSFFSSADGRRWTGRDLSHARASFVDGVWTGTEFFCVGSQVNQQRFKHGIGIFSSPDALIWTREDTPPHHSLNAIASHEGMVVAVGDESTLLTSTDSRSWQKIPLAGQWDFKDVTWTGHEFLVGGNSGIMFASEDGITWSMRSPGSLEAVAWDGKRFVALGGLNVFESLDGIAWPPLAVSDPKFYLSDGPNEMTDLIWTGNRFIGVGEWGQLVVSDDGNSWTKVEGASGNLRCSISFNDRVLVCGNPGLYELHDDLILTRISTPFLSLADIAHNGSSFMAVSWNSIWTSPDGLTWTENELDRRIRLGFIAHSNGEWVIGGQMDSAPGPNSYLARSSDGLTWTAEIGQSDRSFSHLVSSNGRHLALDQTGKARIFQNGTWAEEITNLNGTPSALLAVSDTFHAFSENGSHALRTSEGSWITGDVRASGNTIYLIAASSDQTIISTVVPFSVFNRAFFSSLDGRNWTALESPETFPFAKAWLRTDNGLILAHGDTLFHVEDGIFSEEEKIADLAQPQICSLARFHDKILASTGREIMRRSEEGTFEQAIQLDSGYPAVLVAGDEQVLLLRNQGNLSSRDGIKWEELAEPVPDNFTLHEVISSPGGFHAVGQDRRILHSEDGRNWDTTILPLVSDLVALAFSGERYAAVGRGIVSSADGLTWELAEAGDPEIQYHDLAWGAGIFVAVGEGVIATSPDGRNWTRQEMEHNLQSIIWTGGNGGKFITHTSDQMVLHSPDGLSWSIKVLPKGSITQLAHHNGVTLAANVFGDCFQMSDGVNWEVSPDLKGVSWIRSENNFLFANTATGLAISSDGKRWTITSAAVYALAWDGSRFLGLNRTNQIITSTNGVNWRPLTGDSLPQLARDLVWTGEQFIVVGAEGMVATSPDGTNWTPQDWGTTEILFDLVWTGSQAVALGTSNTIIFSDAGPAPPLPDDVIGRSVSWIEEKLVVTCHGGVIAVLKNDLWNLIQTETDADLRVLTIVEDHLVVMGEAATHLTTASLDPLGPWTLQAQTGKRQSFERSLSSFGDQLYWFKRSDPLASTDGSVWKAPAPDTFPSIGVSALAKPRDDLFAFHYNGSMSRILPDNTIVSENLGENIRTNSAAYHDGKFVAVGEGGSIFLSVSEARVVPTYGEWLTNSGAIGERLLPLEDWDKDGLANLIEYVFQTDPVTPDPPHLRNLLHIENDRLVFTALTNQIAAEIFVERSLDLETWQVIASKSGTEDWSGVAIATESPASGALIRVVVTDSTIAPNLFYRIKIVPR